MHAPPVLTVQNRCELFLIICKLRYASWHIHTVPFATAICFCFQWDEWGLLMLQSHNVQPISCEKKNRNRICTMWTSLNGWFYDLVVQRRNQSTKTSHGSKKMKKIYRGPKVDPFHTFLDPLGAEGVHFFDLIHYIHQNLHGTSILFLDEVNCFTKDFALRISAQQTIPNLEVSHLRLQVKSAGGTLILCRFRVVNFSSRLSGNWIIRVFPNWLSLNSVSKEMLEIKKGLLELAISS